MNNYKVWPQVLVAIAANVGPFIQGISLGWSAPAGPMILNSDHKFLMTPSEFSWSVSMMPLGGALACVVSGLFRNRFGTKITVLLFTLPNLLGWLLLVFSWNSLMITFGRFFIGIAGGAYSFNIPVFIGEFSSKEIRGILLTLYQVFVMLGVVFVYSVGSTTNFYTMNVICGSLVVFYAIIFIFLPESPVFLVRKCEIVKAEKSIKILRGEKFDAKLEILFLQQVQNEVMQAPKTSFSLEFRKRSTFKAFLIIIFMFFFFQMSGVNAILFYATSIFIEADVTVKPSSATIVLGLIQVLATLATILFVDRLGRVFLLKISFCVMIVALCGVGTFFYIKVNCQGSYKFINWLPLPSLYLFCIGFSAGLGSVPFILVGEIFSADAKKVIAPFAQTMNFVMALVVGVMFPYLSNNIGTGLTFFVFAGFCVLGLIFTLLAIPETKGKSLMEIQTLLNK